jgi:CRP-like cAMP-binding protein
MITSSCAPDRVSPRPAGTNTAVHDLSGTSMSRTKSFPQLHRQISFARSMGSVVLPTTTRAISPEEALKVQRYERMMDHFQLRHVPLARTASMAGTPSARHDGSSTTEPLTQTPSRHHSITDLATVAAATDTARQIQRRLRGKVYAVNADADEEATTHYQVLKTVPPRFSFRASSWTSLPWSPTSLPTRVRLILLMLVFTAQLVYMPYGIVYYPPNRRATIVLDSMADATFLFNIFATCFTEVHSGKGPPNTSLRAIRRHYWKRGLFVDVLAAMPFELTLAYLYASWLRWVVRIAHICVQYMSLLRHVNRFHRAWKREVIRVDKSLIAWILYSRYGHLVRIGSIVCLVMIMAHYFACVWSSLQAAVDATFLTSRDPMEIHMHSIYDALQLLQGQGLPISTPAQALFGSFAVLLGSIALAVIFGHVAILVSNFSANQTSYQRKMERVFAIMGKLQLPHPIRERIHQYYEYLHAEYESLDGEIVKFAKDLSHTLELEVVLFKYMDVLMHVPHWRMCSPDFQKQLVLNLGVRVYLPDDFIMRRGEVGTECYIINRGTCKQHEYSSGNSEPPTLPMASDDRDVQRSRTRGRHSSQTFSRRFSQSSTTASTRVRDQTQGKFNSRYSMPESGRSDLADLSPYSKVTVLRRGQAIGDIALIANYERSSDVRAVSYVEMCVIERETFQRILTRYPHDREIVLNSIVHHTMLHLAADHVPCMLMQMVRDVVPTATVTTGIKLMARAMNPRENDPTIVFGVTEQLKTRLQALAPRQIADDLTDSHHLGLDEPEPPAFANEEHSRTHPAVANPHSRNQRGEHLSTSSAAESKLFRMAREMQAQLTRIEERQLNDSKTASRCNSQSALAAPRPNRSTASAAALIRVPPAMARSKSRHRLLRGQSVKVGVGVGSQQPGVSKWSNMAPLTLPLDGDALVNGSTVIPDATTPFSAPKRILQDLVGTLWSKPAEVAQDQSLTPCADQLFQSRRQSPNASPLRANLLNFKSRRGSSGVLDVHTYHHDQLREDHRRSSLQRLNGSYGQ